MAYIRAAYLEGTVVRVVERGVKMKKKKKKVPALRIR